MEKAQSDCWNGDIIPEVEWHELPNEELPMTYQIGVVASDGVLLASDRLYSRFGQGAASTHSADKIVVHQPLGLAYCCSGDDLSVAVAQDICAGYPWPANVRDHLTIAAQNVAINWKHKQMPGRGGSVLFARKTNDAVELWRVQVSTPAFAERIDDRVPQGDPSNNASFFIEHYLPIRNGYRKLPLENLKFVAAHIILMAAHSGVSGLEILLCRPDAGFYRLNEEEIDELKQKSAALDRTIQSSLGL